MQIDAFDVDDWPHARLQDGERLAMRHPVLVVEEAIIGELHRHADASPKWAAMKSAMPLISSR